jgi:glucose dehydrogenase
MQRFFRKLENLALADGKVYVGSDDKNVYCLNAATGALIWSYETGGAVESSPAVANGVVYVGSFDKKVYAFSAAPPIPEFPSWLLLSLALVATGFVVFRKKEQFLRREI